jgi:hypothetical protein
MVKFASADDEDFRQIVARLKETTRDIREADAKSKLVQTQGIRHEDFATWTSLTR